MRNITYLFLMADDPMPDPPDPEPGEGGDEDSKG
jgi:hypothetical protein